MWFGTDAESSSDQVAHSLAALAKFISRIVPVATVTPASRLTVLAAGNQPTYLNRQKFGLLIMNCAIRCIQCQICQNYFSFPSGMSGIADGVLVQGRWFQPVEIGICMFSTCNSQNPSRFSDRCLNP